MGATVAWSFYKISYPHLKKWKNHDAKKSGILAAFLISQPLQNYVLEIKLFKFWCHVSDVSM